jgi:hypothetical protein
LLADPLEGVRSVGTVKRCQFSAGHGCEGPQPSRPLPIIVATAGRPLLADPLEGVRSVGAVKRCQFSSGHGCEGPQPFKPPPVIVATAGRALLADPWRASAPSAPRNAASFRPATAARDRSPPSRHRSSLPRRKGIAGRSLEGVRSVGAAKRCQFSAGNGCEGPQTFYRFSRDILCKLVAINSELGGLEL